MKISYALIIEKHHETIEEFCDRTGYTEVFTQEGRWWGFPPAGVMPVEIDVTYKYEIKWCEEVNEFMPFYAVSYFLKDFSTPWKFKIIGNEQYGRDFICVRTDIYPLAWMFWWVYLRIEKSLNLIGTFLNHLLEIWGLSEIEKGSYPSWKDIKILKKFIHH